MALAVIHSSQVNSINYTNKDVEHRVNNESLPYSLAAFDVLLEDLNNLPEQDYISSDTGYYCQLEQFVNDLRYGLLFEVWRAVRDEKEQGYNFSGEVFDLALDNLDKDFDELQDNFKRWNECSEDDFEERVEQFITQIEESLTEISESTQAVRDLVVSAYQARYQEEFGTDLA